MIIKTKENIGITLIALVITIIILILLLGITIEILIGKNGLIEKANGASFETEIAKYKEELELSIGVEQIDTLGSRTKKINTEDANKIKSKYIPSFNKEKYSGKIIIKDDKLVYIGKDKEEYIKAIENGLIPDDELIDDEILEEYQPFITEWTVADNDTIVLPLYTYSHNIYDFQVDYGDGTVVKVTSATDENATHVYQNAGIYTVTIKGQCPGFHFSGYNKEESNQKITKIIQWGNVLKNEGGIDLGIGIDFKNCVNLKGPIPKPTRNSLSKCYNVSFENCKSLDGNIPKNLFKDCVKIGSFTNTFLGCTSLTGEIPGELFSDCEETTSFSGCFAGCTGITSISGDLFKNCTKVDNFQGCFSGCTSITKIPDNLFANCTKVINYRQTFANNQSLESIGSNVFNCETNVDFWMLFENCFKLNSIPEDLFRNCPNAVSFERALNTCTSLTEIPEGLFDNCNNVKNFWRTFAGSANLTGNAPKLWERTNVEKYSGCFAGCNKLSNIDEIPSDWGGKGD